MYFDKHAMIILAI